MLYSVHYGVYALNIHDHCLLAAYIASLVSNIIHLQFRVCLVSCVSMAREGEQEEHGPVLCTLASVVQITPLEFEESLCLLRSLVGPKVEVVCMPIKEPSLGPGVISATIIITGYSSGSKVGLQSLRVHFQVTLQAGLSQKAAVLESEYPCIFFFNYLISNWTRRTIFLVS